MEEGVLRFVAMLVAMAVISGVFWGWVLWRIAKLKAVAESNVARRVFKGLSLFVGIGMPIMTIVAAGLFVY